MKRKKLKKVKKSRGGGVKIKLNKKIMSSIDELIVNRVKEEVSSSVKIATTGLRFEVEKSVTESVLQGLKAVRPIKIISGNSSKDVPPGLRHEKTSTILEYIGARLSVLMVGPAGSGKTHIATQCADMLGLDHYSMSVNEQTSKSDFLGYKDASGKIVKTNFRTAYENGGVFIIDEIDAGNPNILTVINSALSNDFCPFPDGMIKRHKDFVCVCTANTFGEGENIQYIGRNILDSATKDRFISVFIDYSASLEKVLVPKYVALLKELRAYFAKNNTLFVVSTRGGLRLETLAPAEKKATYDEIVDSLNLHQLVGKDIKVKEIVTKYL